MLNNHLKNSINTKIDLDDDNDKKKKPKERNDNKKETKEAAIYNCVDVVKVEKLVVLT